MLINFSQIKKLPVYTVSGTYLGKVVDVTLMVEQTAVYEFKVRSRLIGGRIFLIRPSQVIEISTKKITVEDAILPDPLKAENAGEAAMG